MAEAILWFASAELFMFYYQIVVILIFDIKFLNPDKIQGQGQ